MPKPPRPPPPPCAFGRIYTHAGAWCLHGDVVRGAGLEILTLTLYRHHWNNQHSSGEQHRVTLDLSLPHQKHHSEFLSSRFLSF